LQPLCTCFPWPCVLLWWCKKISSEIVAHFHFFVRIAFNIDVYSYDFIKHKIRIFGGYTYPFSVDSNQLSVVTCVGSCQNLFWTFLVGAPSQLEMFGSARSCYRSVNHFIATTCPCRKIHGFTHNALHTDIPSLGFVKVIRSQMIEAAFLRWFRFHLFRNARIQDQQQNIIWNCYTAHFFTGHNVLRYFQC